MIQQRCDGRVKAVSLPFKRSATPLLLGVTVYTPMPPSYSCILQLWLTATQRDSFTLNTLHNTSAVKPDFYMLYVFTVAVVFDAPLACELHEQMTYFIIWL